MFSAQLKSVTGFKMDEEVVEESFQDDRKVKTQHMLTRTEQTELTHRTTADRTISETNGSHQHGILYLLLQEYIQKSQYEISSHSVSGSALFTHCQAVHSCKHCGGHSVIQSSEIIQLKVKTHANST